MLLQNDPFRDIDAWFDRMTGRTASNGQWPMPMDAYKRDNDLWVDIDLPGVSSQSIEINVERNVLTVSAQRDWDRKDGDQIYLAERHRGTFRRQVHLGDGLDADRIEARYNDGVLTLRIPVAAAAQPKKIEVQTGGSSKAIDTSSTE
jgi:HSP20 family protein